LHARVTLVLSRTRRRDECAMLKEGVRRRVRKSRQKEAGGAADAGLMQIEWTERGVLQSLRLGLRTILSGGTHLAAPLMQEEPAGLDGLNCSCTA